MRPTILLLTTLFATASLVVAQTPSAAPKAPAASSPATTTTTTASSPATTTSTSAMPSDAEMMKQMMEMAKIGDNHKLLASMDGTWDYTVKFWMNGDPTSKPQESKGVATRKSVMGGRFFTMDVKGKMQMPGPDGKPKDMEFTGMGIDAYDNAKQKFVGAWVDNMGTGIMVSEGTYDAATKTFNYTGTYQMTPTMNQKIREVLKFPDGNHMTFEWFEDRGGKEVKTMQIDYTKKK